LNCKQPTFIMTEPLIDCVSPGLRVGNTFKAKMEREALFTYLDKALADMREVLVERGKNYADIADNSRVFTQIMTALGVKLPDGMTETQYHCFSNIATKMARYATGNKGHDDNFVDMANYGVLMMADTRRGTAAGPGGGSGGT